MTRWSKRSTKECDYFTDMDEHFSMCALYCLLLVASHTTPLIQGWTRNMQSVFYILSDRLNLKNKHFFHFNSEPSAVTNIRSSTQQLRVFVIPSQFRFIFFLFIFWVSGPSHVRMPPFVHALRYTLSVRHTGRTIFLRTVGFPFWKKVRSSIH